MLVNSKQAGKIYENLADEESKNVFLKRLAFNLVPSRENIHELARLGDAGIIDAIEKFTDCGVKVCVYGVGRHRGHPGRVMCSIFRDHLAAALDRDAEHIGEINDYGLNTPVWKPEKISEFSDGDMVVIIATQNTKYQKEMLANLAELGVLERNVRSVMFHPPLDYFNWPFFKYGEVEIFVDCGCFDGETSRQFIEKIQKQPNASVAKIFAYEPDEKHYAVCVGNLADVPFARVKNLGAWSKNETLCFYEGARGSSRISDAGDLTINAVALDDDLAEEQVTFIKMDVESAELNALKGAEKLIRANRPKLAICVYHKPEDILEIPEFIINLNLNYRLYLRHQSYTMFETIVYATPN